MSSDTQDSSRRTVCKQVKSFQWMQTFQRGDLGIRLTDEHGNPYNPVRIWYTMYQPLPGGLSIKQIGPEKQAPVQGDVGEFYATGRAGELGQPGEWIIRWTYQKTSESEPLSTETRFQVVVNTGDCHKYGWD